MNQKAESNSQAVKDQGHSKVLPMIGIDSEKNQKSDTGSIQKTCNEMAYRKHTMQIHLRQEYRCTAVWNQSDQSGNKNAGYRTGSNVRDHSLLSDSLKCQIQYKGDNENK